MGRNICGNCNACLGHDNYCLSCGGYWTEEREPSGNLVFQVFRGEPRRAIVDSNEERFFSTGGGRVLPTLTEHPWCDDPNCTYCSDEAWYAQVRELEVVTRFEVEE